MKKFVSQRGYLSQDTLVNTIVTSSAIAFSWWTNPQVRGVHFHLNWLLLFVQITRLPSIRKEYILKPRGSKKQFNERHFSLLFEVSVINYPFSRQKYLEITMHCCVGLKKRIIFIPFIPWNSKYICRDIK